MLALAGCAGDPFAPLLEETVGLERAQAADAASARAEPEIALDASAGAEDYVRLALARNPAIRAAERRVDRLRERVAQAESLPDPRLHVAPIGEMAETAAAASTIFWIDPREDLVVIFMTQLLPSATFNFRGQLKSIVYSSIID